MEIEELEQKLHIQGTDQTVPVFINLTNDLNLNIENVTFSLLFRLESKEEYKVAFVENYSIRSKGQRHELVFEASGFRVISIIISDLKYIDQNSVTHTEYSGNTPILLDVDELQNQFFGCRNKKELETRMILESYLNNGFIARSLLLKRLFKLLKDVNETNILNLEEPVPLNEYTLDYFRGIVQVDIVSKIMMYTEDLLVLSLSILENDGNFYEWLDMKKPDIGERIGNFLRNKGTFTDNQWRRVLSYINVHEMDIDNPTKILLDKLIALNIFKFKRLLGHIEQFADSHIILSRRYKHAGSTGMMELIQVHF